MIVTKEPKAKDLEREGKYKCEGCNRNFKSKSSLYDIYQRGRFRFMKLCKYCANEKIKEDGYKWDGNR